MAQQKPIISTSFSYETLEETLDIKPKGAQLHIGIPKEIAFQENRIALTPDAVSVLVSNGHAVTIEHNAGEAAHFRDKDYSEAGANSVYRLKRLQNNVGHRLWTSVIEPRMLAKQLKTCEVAVGALSSQSGRTPIVVTE